MTTLTLDEIQEQLGYKDLKAVRNWCSEHDVLVVRQGKAEFVYEVEFKLAYELPFMNKLKARYGDDWEQVYNLYNDGNIPALNMLKDSKTNRVPIYKNKKENQFVTKIKDYEKTKNAA